MLHTTLIAIHAIAALTCFVTGLIVVYQVPQTPGQVRLFQLYFASLILMVVFMLAAIIVDWPQLATVTQVSFLALGMLAMYMLVRGFQARNALEDKSSGWEKRFINHVGFTLISLFDGFIIVSALDLNVPGWLIAISAVAAVVVGISIVNSLQRRVA